jgi:hypothetical protein
LYEWSIQCGELWGYPPATSLDQALLLGAEALRLDGECPLSPGGVLGQGGRELGEV